MIVLKDAKISLAINNFVIDDFIQISTLNVTPLPSSSTNKQIDVDVDNILTLCGSRNIVPDTILLNSAIDAYIR